MADNPHKIIPRSEFEQVLANAWKNSQTKDAVEHILAYKDLVYDDGDRKAPSRHNLWQNTIVEDIEPNTGKPTLRINVQHMISTYVGGGYEVSVEQEHWGANVYTGKLRDNVDHQIAIHLRKLADNPNCEIITLREPMYQFPSAELRAKLELLKY